MRRPPSSKALLASFLIVAIITINYSYLGWADLFDVADEYRIKAGKLQLEGRIDQAIEYYQKVIGLDKYCLAAYNGLAICYEKKGWLLRAQESYQQALDLNPQYPPAHLNLGLLYERCGKIDKALFHWRRRLRFGPRATRGWRLAREKLKKYAPEQLQKEEARELSGLIAAQKEKGLLDQLIGKKKYIIREEKIGNCYYNGMQKFQEGDFRKAADYFQKMIETLPISN